MDYPYLVHSGRRTFQAQVIMNRWSISGVFRSFLFLISLGMAFQWPCLIPLQSVELQIIPSSAHDIELTSDSDLVLRSSGSDPYIRARFTDSNLEEGETILSFEYFSLTGVRFLQVFLSPGENESESQFAPGLEPSQGWARYWVSLANLIPLRDMDRIHGLRLDFGDAAGMDWRFRNMQIRRPTSVEQTILDQQRITQNKQSQHAQALRNYCDRSDWPARIDSVRMHDGKITIRGQIHGDKSEAAGCRLAAFPISADPTSKPDPIQFFSIPGREFEVGISISDCHYEMPTLLKWAVVNPEATELASPFHYLPDVISIHDYPELKPANRKGLGAWGPGRPESDLKDLDVSAVTINILLHQFLRSQPCPECEPWDFAGTTWYIHQPTIGHYDRWIHSAAQYKLLVSAILLIPQAAQFADKEIGRRMAHPDADPTGIYVMPNVSDPLGVQTYAAALEYLAQRYGRADARFGRIHHWIIHNEVNSGWVWTNAGKKSSLEYLDLYLKSMRMVHLIARIYNPSAQVFISLDHHWTTQYGQTGYKGRDMLEHLRDLCQIEGDFPWALAFHPYSQNLFDPKVWLNDEAQDIFNTPKITFKNLSVLDRWFAQPDFQFLGQRRIIHLTEQGLNSPDYSDESLRNQSAGMAYAWRQMRSIPSISMFHYHNWVDHRQEGGLRIGLRKFPDDHDDPLGRKPIWYLFQALNTPQESQAIAQALSNIPGLSVRE